MARSIPTKYYDEIYPSRQALATAKGIDYKALSYQIKSGKSIEQAVDKLLGVKPVTNNTRRLTKEQVNELKKTEESLINKEESTVDNTIDDDIEETNVNSKEDDIEENTEKFLMYEYLRSPSDISKFDIENIETINLIDFENMSDKNFDMLSYINKKNAINIFCYNSCIYSNSFFKFIKKSENMNLQLLSHHCGNNLVDNMILFYLSSLITLYPDKDYIIISQDNGFYDFVDAINKPNVFAVGKKRIKDRKDRYRYSLFKYILDNNIIAHRNVIKISEFDIVFEEFFKNKNRTPDIPGMIKYLSDFEVIERKYLGNLEYYKFNITKIKEFVDENK